jgi:hypothetical protein
MMQAPGRRGADTPMTRRRFVVATVAGVAGFELLRASPVRGASTVAPKPIPGGFTIPDFTLVPSGADIHVLPPAIGFEMSTITDFNGVIAATEIQGTATGSDGASYTFDTDMRFMTGEYVGEDGLHHHGTFGFV